MYWLVSNLQSFCSSLWVLELQADATIHATEVKPIGLVLLVWSLMVLGDREREGCYLHVDAESKLCFQNPLTLYVQAALAAVQKPSPPFPVCWRLLGSPANLHRAGKSSRNSVILQCDFIFISLLC